MLSILRFLHVLECYMKADPLTAQPPPDHTDTTGAARLASKHGELILLILSEGYGRACGCRCLEEQAAPHHSSSPRSPSRL